MNTKEETTGDKPRVSIQRVPNPRCRLYGTRTRDMEATRSVVETVVGVDWSSASFPYKMQVSIGSCFDWEEVEPRILAAIATVTYGVEAEALEITQEASYAPPSLGGGDGIKIRRLG